MPKTVWKMAAVLVLLAGVVPSALAGENPLDAWKPAFDPVGAEYTYVLSNIAHPGIAGIGVGYKIRDQVWERSKGRFYVDFRPLAQLGGGKDVISKLKLGAVQGMMSSSVAAANISDKLGIVNLPYVVDTFDKLDKFRNTPELWTPFRDAALAQGLMVVDITTSPTFSAGAPRVLFTGRYGLSPTGVTGYCLSVDGRRFLRTQQVQPAQPLDSIDVVLNWFEQLEQARIKMLARRMVPCWLWIR